MRKIKFFGGPCKFLATMAFCVCAAAALGQDVVKQDSSVVNPAGVFQLIKPSCMPCHSNEGRDKPRRAVNFSVWEQYTAMEKMMLASSIQKEVQRRDMPPKGFINSHPGTALDSLQIIKLVQWCDSLKSKPQ
jgi:hypothetical protein